MQSFIRAAHGNRGLLNGKLGTEGFAGQAGPGGRGSSRGGGSRVTKPKPGGLIT